MSQGKSELVDHPSEVWVRHTYSRRHNKVSVPFA